MPSDLEKLQALSKYVHDALRTLKIGDSATISCTKEFPAGEIKPYLIAYAFHKRKWFETKHDVVANVIYTKRVSVPSFLPPGEPDELEEL